MSKRRITVPWNRMPDRDRPSVTVIRDRARDPRTRLRRAALGDARILVGGARG